MVIDSRAPVDETMAVVVENSAQDTGAFDWITIGYLWIDTIVKVATTAFDDQTR